MQSNQNKFRPLLFVLIFILGLAALAIFGYWGYLKFFVTNNQTQTSTVKEDQKIDQGTRLVQKEVIIPSEWKTFSNQKFTFRYPKDAVVYLPDEEVVKATYSGPKQSEATESGTEFFDGYTFTINTLKKSSTASAKIAAEKTNLEAKNVCEAGQVGEITETSLNGISAFQYSSSCFGNSENYYLSNGMDIYEVSQFFVGEVSDKNKYEVILDQILSTFKFL